MEDNVDKDRVRKLISEAEFYLGSLRDEFEAGNQQEAFNAAEQLDAQVSGLTSELEPRQ